MAKRSKQYSFHLNLNNPDHLKIYRTLEDLNTDIHKSVSNFVIKAVIQYINDASTDAGSTEIDNETVEPTTEAVTVETEDAGTAQQESTGTVNEVDSSADTKDTGKSTE